MNRIIALIIKELIGVIRDPKTRFSLLAPPLIQLFIFTFAATLDVTNATIGILNRDWGEKGFELIQRFRGSPMFSHIHTLHSINEIGPFMDEQKGMMVIHIDEDFSRKIDAGAPANVQLLLDGRKSNAAQIVGGYANEILDRFSRDVQKKEQNAILTVINWFNPNLLYYWYNIPSLVATLSMLTSLVVTSVSVAREKELGTFDQLLVSPLSTNEIVWGKIIPGIIVGILEATLMIFCGHFIFGVPFMGSLLLLYASLLVFLCAIAGVGLFISSLCSTQQQAMLGTFTFMVPSILLSGFATPVENMPEWLQPVTYLLPLKYMLVISKGIFLKAMPAQMVFNNVWPMALIALFTLGSAGQFFRRRLQ